MSFLKEESGGSLKMHWNPVRVKQVEKTLLLLSRWRHAHVGVSEIFLSVGQNFWR